MKKYTLSLLGPKSHLAPPFFPLYVKPISSLDTANGADLLRLDATAAVAVKFSVHVNIKLLIPLSFVLSFHNLLT